MNMKLLFVIEAFLYLGMFLFPYDVIKYVSILLIFLYSLFIKKGRINMLCIMIADTFLLFTDQYLIGITFFILVQCLYHYQLSDDHYFYGLLGLCFIVDITSYALCYAVMSFTNIIMAIKKKHWLLLTLILLALCDLGVAIQFVTGINQPYIWLFYLPSQLFFIKNVSSKQMKQLKWKTSDQSTHQNNQTDFKK